MSERSERIGQLAEEYSHIKGQLHDIEERLHRTHVAYQFAGQNFADLRVINGKLDIPPPGRAPTQIGLLPAHLDDLFSASQLIEYLEERERLNGMLHDLGDKLKALAPHLL